MKNCNYCQNLVEENVAVCPFCGYDFKSGILTQVLNKKKKAEPKSGGIDPRVKKFAYAGIAITLFTVLYSYNFRINILFFDLKDRISAVKIGKFSLVKSDKKKAKAIEPIELTDVRSYHGQDSSRKSGNFTLEGIFFDPLPGAKNYVTVSGQVLSEGESLGGISIKKINKSTIEVIVEGKNEILEVDQSIAYK